MRKFVILILIVLSLTPAIQGKGIPVVDISVIEKISSIASDIMGWYRDRKKLLDDLTNISEKYLSKFLSVYKKISYKEYLDIGIDDIREILETGPNFWDCFGENTWWEIWSGEKTYREVYPELNKEDGVKDLEGFEDDQKVQAYLEYLAPVLKEMEKESENEVELIKKSKELNIDAAEKIEAFDRMTNTASRLTGNKDRTQSQIKVVRVLFNIIQIKIEQLGMRYREGMFERNKLKKFIKNSVRGYVEAKKIEGLVTEEAEK